MLEFALRANSTLSPVSEPRKGLRLFMGMVAMGVGKRRAGHLSKNRHNTPARPRIMKPAESGSCEP
jgi:hypothetical protein